MSNPSRVFTLAVPATGEFVQPDPLPFPANVVITMAAIDPTATALGDGPKLATLKILHRPVATEFDAEDYLGEDYSDSDEDDEEEEDDDEENEDEDDEAKQSKSSRKKAAAAAIQKLLDETTAMDVDESKFINGKKTKKAKKATEEDDSESEEDGDEEDSEDDEDFVEESVICTLDPTRLYQQPLNIVIADGEEVLFKSTGAYTVYLSGNYTMPDSHNHSDDEDYDDEFDLSPGEDDYYLNGLGDSDEESDDLDDLKDPRISEVVSDEEEIVIAAPKLSKKEKKAAAKAAVEIAKKVEKAIAPAEPATKKRAADEMEVDSPKPSTNGAKPAAAAPETPALSKKQLKKLKANNGEAAAAPSPSSEKKKVQFASELEQGPTPSGTKSAATTAAASPSAKPAAVAAAKPTAAAAAKPAGPSSRNVKGVELVDKKVGTGVEAKNGQKVSMRYIGKLLNGKTFDSNTKGKPFTFKLGAGEVIKGWDIGIAGMKVGGERKLTIPAGLAYGNSGTPGIPKNSVLTFEVKLLEIK